METKRFYGIIFAVLLKDPLSKNRAKKQQNHILFTRKHSKYSKLDIQFFVLKMFDCRNNQQVCADLSSYSGPPPQPLQESPPQPRSHGRLEGVFRGNRVAPRGLPLVRHIFIDFPVY